MNELNVIQVGEKKSKWSHERRHSKILHCPS